MAEAVGQLTGAPAAVMGTRAVGAGNMAIVALVVILGLILGSIRFAL